MYLRKILVCKDSYLKYTQRRKNIMANIIFRKPETCLFTSVGPKMYLS